MNLLLLVNQTVNFNDLHENKKIKASVQKVNNLNKKRGKKAKN